MSTSINTVSEPWHLRYCTGDQLPPAVLAYEAATHPTPEDIMAGEAKYVRPNDGDPKQFIISGKLAAWIVDGAEKAAHVVMGSAIPTSGTPTLVDRGIFENFILVGPAPVYGPDESLGARTYAGHFQAHVV